MIKDCAVLWDDLSFYIWAGNFRKANNVCKLLDEIKTNSLFVFWAGYFIYPFIGVV